MNHLWQQGDRVGIARLNMEKLRESAAIAAASQWRALSVLRGEARVELEVRPLTMPKENLEAVGVVAADAGLVSVELSPFSLEFLHVADSRGEVHLSEIFPLTTMAEDLQVIFDRNPVLTEFANRLGVQWEELTNLWAVGMKEERLFPRDVKLVADALRELAEWAVCCKLAVEVEPQDKPPGLRRLVLHDGLLRSVLMRNQVIQKELPDWWREEAWFRRGVAVAGVGKSSLVWERLSVTLDLDERVQHEQECYIIVPPEVEQSLSGRVATDKRFGFGQLVLLKTRPFASGVYLPVDLPEWIVRDRAALEAVLAQAAHVSKTTFPRPGYPAPLGTAHEAAHLSAFDAKVIRDQVLTALREMEGMDSSEFERLLRNWAFKPDHWEKTGRVGRF